jgi:hypothetical protein
MCNFAPNLIAMRNQIILILFLPIFFACSTSKKTTGNIKANTISQLNFLGEYDIPNSQQFKGTTVGGLSGIDYDPKNGIYYIISDDRSDVNPARFYTAKIHLNEHGIDSVEFVDVITLLQKDGKAFPGSKQDPLHSPDPEAMRCDQLKDELVWSSEGERIIKAGNNVLEDPTVIAIGKNGKYKDSFALPPNMHMHATENGPRRNGVFEGLTFANDYKYLFVNVEEPIYEDGPRAGLKDSTAWIRIIKFDADTRNQIAQYAYQIEAVVYPPVPADAFRINGVPDILWVGKNKLIVVERSFSTGRIACTIRVFLADVKGATNIADLNSLQAQPAVRPISKKLLLNMDELGRYIDNIEGVTFGPDLPNGHRSLIFVADDNFSKNQKNQFLLFEVMP